MFAKRSDMPTLSTTEESYSSYTATVPTTVNPYINISTEPQNLVFIIVGGIIGLVLIVFVIVRLYMYWLAGRRAKNEKEVYYNSFVFGSNTSSSSFFGGHSSSSSMWEKNSSNGLSSANSSIYMLSKMSSGSLLNQTEGGQGRSYRNALNKDNALVGNRGSMFISPVMQMSTTSLPQPFLSGLDDPSTGPGLVDTSVVNSPALPGPYNTIGSSYLDELRPQYQTKSKPSRPPSQLLDDLLDEV